MNALSAAARLLAILACVWSVNGCALRGETAQAAQPSTFESAADSAIATLERSVYVAPGRWRLCIPDGCGSAVRDWGADALTYTLYLRWSVDHDAAIVPMMAALGASSPRYGACRLPDCTAWSDVPMWDAIADARDYTVSGDPEALGKARAAFALVDASDAFARGACPEIDYQRPEGGRTKLKTLETDSNYIKAALLLAGLTRDPAYLVRARVKYAAVRRRFLDARLPLYTTYVFDDGTSCTPIAGRFFASVNGNMIDAGLMLAERTGDRRYLAQARDTAWAVATRLGDDAGIYVDPQADNDVAEPLVEAMYDLATRGRTAFARRWLIANAAALVPGTAGAYGRFFGGPPPVATTSAWSASGGFALAVAAGALAGRRERSPASLWANAEYVADPLSSAPATIAFSGRAIALIGAIGAVCCEPGHVRVFIDGRETIDTTGIWQNKSPAARTLPDSVLLSWRWPRAGRHTITLEPGTFNAKEGGSSLRLAGYEVVP